MKSKIKIRPMSIETAKLEGKGISITQPGKGIQGLESPEVFGDSDNKPDGATKSKKVDIYNNVGFIRLPVSYANEFICGVDYAILKKIMPKRYIKEKYGTDVSVSEIINTPMIMDRNSDSLVSMRFGDQAGIDFKKTIYDEGRFLLGGDVVKYLLKQVNFQEELEFELLEFAAKTLNTVANNMGYGRSNKSLRKEKLSVVRTETSFPIIEDYYVSIEPSENSVNLSVNDEFIDLYYKMNRKRLCDEISTSRIAALLPLLQREDAIDDMLNILQNFVIVLPIGYRPTTNEGTHPLTRQYEKVLTCVSSLESAISSKSFNIETICNYYKDMVKNIKVVNIGQKDVKMSSGYKDVKSTLIGKNGLIRNRLQSSIIDYAARSVIISDPNLSIRQIGVPYKILRNIVEIFYVESINFKTDLMPEDKIKEYESIKKDSNSARMKKFIDSMVKNIPIAMGRQPTLYALGIQGFDIKPIEGEAIALAPLVVSAFNADFDGDQTYVVIPISHLAQKEVREKMGNINNIYLPKDGECHISPRHEIIYGLWYGSKAKPTGKVVINESKVTVTVLNTAINYILNDVHEITDIVEIGGNRWSLGQFVVKACAGVKCCDYIIGSPRLEKGNKISIKNKSDAEVNDTPDGVCTAKWCVSLLTHIRENSRDNTNTAEDFVNTVNNYTKVGFAIACNYPPNLSIVNIPDISKLVDEFEENIHQAQVMYEIGMETKTGYDRIFTDAYDKLYSTARKQVDEFLTSENGYIEMRDSKCRGDSSTVMQTFGLKGRMQRGSGRAFNAIVEHSMAHGLTGLEHYVTAYGGRQGQIDKSIETSTPGYISRTMAHANNEIRITTRDCGTTNGLHITFDGIAKFLDYEEGPLLYDQVEDYFVSMVKGRYLVESSSVNMDETFAREIFRGMVASYEDGKIKRLSGVHLRSPITCDNPCCIKCYGILLRKRKFPEIGFACGFEAAQSIGEPGTQLTMKTFQGGGVVSDANLTSSFDTMRKYMNLTNQNPSDDSPMITDMLVSEDCEIREVLIGNNIKNIYLIKDGRVINDPLTYYSDVRFKKVVEAGSNIMKTPGNLNIDNVVDVLGTDEAIMYLTMKLYNIFWKESFVNLKHFEVLVSSMVFYTCVKSFGDFKAGLKYTRIQYLENGGDQQPENFAKVIIGIQNVTHESTNILRGLLFERSQESISKHILKANTDELVTPYVRMSLGLV